MKFGDAVASGLRKYATFSGRATRSEYWWFYLFTVLVGMAASIVGAVVHVQAIRLLADLALLLPSLAVAVRRLHDTDRSGWWLVLLAVVPAVVAVALVVIGIASGVAAGFAVMGSATHTAHAAAGAAICLILAAGFIVLAAGVTLTVFLALPSKDPNRYGPNPKEVSGYGHSQSGTYTPYSGTPSYGPQS